MKLLVTAAMVLLCSIAAQAQVKYAQLSSDQPNYRVGQQAQLVIHLNTSIMSPDDEVVIRTDLNPEHLSLTNSNSNTATYLSGRLTDLGPRTWKVKLSTRNKILADHLEAKIAKSDSDMVDLQVQLQHTMDPAQRDEIQRKINNELDRYHALQSQLAELEVFREFDSISFSVTE